MPSEIIKHQPYKQIPIACMAGSQYVVYDLRLNIPPR